MQASSVALDGGLRSVFYRGLFEVVARAGRPFGGFPFPRLALGLATRGYPAPPTGRSEFRWVRDAWGNELLLHPYYDQDRRIISFGCFDRPLHGFLRRTLRPGMTAVDAGANAGEVTLHIAQLVGPAGRVIAVEPVPPIADRLDENLKRNGLELRVRVIRSALGDRAGTLSLAAVTPGIRNQGLSSVASAHQDCIRLDVPCVPLDDLIGSQRVDLIKVDVEGAEAAVLRGAMRALERCRPLLCLEFRTEHLRRTGTRPDELINLLDSLDYRYGLISSRGGVNPVTSDWLQREDREIDNLACWPAGTA